MAAFILESLVLRGVVVLKGAKAVELRLGTSVKAAWRASGTHPEQPLMRPDANGPKPDGDYSSSGAGRSLRSSLATSALGREHTDKETARAVAAMRRLKPVCPAPASVASPSRLATRTLPCGFLPPGRTPPVLSRGQS